MNDKIINLKDIENKVNIKGKFLTDFLTPLEQKNVSEYFKKIDNIKYMTYSHSSLELERSKIYLYSSNSKFDFESSNLESTFDIQIIEIIPNKFSIKLTHKDFLGSLIGLGLKREKIGDIFISSNNHAYIFLSSDITDYVFKNLKRIGHETIDIKKVEGLDSKELKNIVDDHKELEIQITSYRVDNIIAHGFGISRSTVTNLLENESIRINYEVNTNALYQIKEKDLISVKGYGRIKIDTFNGESKKGKKKVKIFLYTKQR